MYYLCFQLLMFLFNFIKFNKIIGFFIFTIALSYFSLSYPGSGDFVGYFSHYDCLINDICNDELSFDKGYELFVKLFGWGGYQSIVFFIGLFNISCIFYFAKSFRKKAFFFLVLLGGMAWPLYTETLRQAMAFSVILIGVKFLSRGETNKYILLVFLAALFHISALISLFAITHTISRRFFKILLSVAFVFLIVFVINPISFITTTIYFLPTSFFAHEKLLFYITSDVYKPGLSLGLGVIPDVMLLAYIVLNLKRANLEKNHYWIYGGILIFVFFVVFIGRVMPVLTRIGWYGLPFLSIFMYSSIWKSNIIPNFDLTHRKINIVIVYLWVFFQIIRPFTYEHSNFNIFKQESIFQNINKLDDASMRNAAEQKCMDLISLGYDDLCYLK